MKKIISMVLAGIMTLTLCFGVAFADEVTADNSKTLLEESADELKGYGILKGDPDGNIRLEDNITRAEAIALLIRANADMNEIAQKEIFDIKFDDVEEHWAIQEISFAHQNGLIDGTTETTFEPERNVTNAEFIKMIITLLGYKPKAEIMGYPQGYVMTASQRGITSDMNLSLDADATRGDVVKMIANSLDVPMMVQSGFGEFEEYAVMDGKNGVKLITLRTIIEGK